MKDQIDLSKMDSIYEIGPYGFNRLNRYWIEPNELMWDYIWENTNMKSYWTDSLKGKSANDYERLIYKYLPLKSKILEAGCGVGQVVLALRARNFDCYGLD
jgi:SAM-dependent methyltransferase